MSEIKDSTRLKSIIEEQRIAISQISHEIRNPVTLINSSLQIIEKDHPEVRTFAFWESVRSDMDYLVQLLDELSNYNNSENLHREWHSSGLWLSEITSSIHGTINSGHQLITNIDQSLPEINIDPIKFRQAITNLLRNAFESLPDQGTVSLNAYTKDTPQQTFFVIEITDNGCGIPDEHLADLFKPFVTHKSFGTGLGLPITKRIVESHEGILEVKSVLGEGTTFMITLGI